MKTHYQFELQTWHYCVLKIIMMTLKIKQNRYWIGNKTHYSTINILIQIKCRNEVHFYYSFVSVFHSGNTSVHRSKLNLLPNNSMLVQFKGKKLAMSLYSVRKASYLLGIGTVDAITLRPAEAPRSVARFLF